MRAEGIKATAKYNIQWKKGCGEKIGLEDSSFHIKHGHGQFKELIK